MHINHYLLDLSKLHFFTLLMLQLQLVQSFLLLKIRLKNKNYVKSKYENLVLRSFLFYDLRAVPNIRLNIKTMITDPINAGIIKNPPNSGPHSPSSIEPSHAPIIPAKILPIIPPGTSLPNISPANHPIIPPTINVQIKLI